MKKTAPSMLLGLAITLAQCASAQTTAFTYQGKLTDGGDPANGLYDLTFLLWDAPTAGTFINASASTATPVTNGLFTVKLDYGSAPFTGARRWLELWSRTNNGANYDILAPRMELTPLPYAIYAQKPAQCSMGLLAMRSWQPTR